MEAIKLKFWIWGIIQNSTPTGIGQKMLLHQVLQNNTWCTTAKTRRGGSTEPPGINTSASLFVEASGEVRWYAQPKMFSYTQ